ncbi:hypothetical protein EGW08_011202 [Elysia chlorotica]|uniref:Transmembrane protein n=1 Tax=Elysia chlorotica TaxID=188477 RepID=A0A3S1C2E4_ELYCH|nr:hypothetical protein EGW08_011202 [Elysia chlorotica]
MNASKNTQNTLGPQLLTLYYIVMIEEECRKVKAQMLKALLFQLWLQIFYHLYISVFWAQVFAGHPSCSHTIDLCTTIKQNKLTTALILSKNTVIIVLIQYQNVAIFNFKYKGLKLNGLRHFILVLFSFIKKKLTEFHTK